MAESALSGYRPPEASGVPHPVRRSPLDAYASDFADLGPRLRVVERPFRAMLDLRFAVDQPNWSYHGVGLPAPLLASGTPERGALWLGPGWFLVLAGKLPVGASSGAVVDAVVSMAAGSMADTRDAGEGGQDQPVSVVDVSGWRTIVDVAGPRAWPVLRTGCSLDLHPDSFGVNACAQTLLARTPVLLQRLPDEALESSMRPCYRVFVRSSYAHHLASWLLDAASGQP